MKNSWLVLPSFALIIFFLLHVSRPNKDGVSANNHSPYKSHEYPVLQLERGKGNESSRVQHAGDKLAKTYLEFIKSKSANSDATSIALDGRKYKSNKVWHAWFHVQNGQVIFNYGVEKK
jgi:hypothetical protein